MSNLFTYLMQFDNDHARDAAQSELFRHHAADDDPDVTLDLGLDDRLDFNATLLAIADARRIQREIDLAWEQHEAAGDGD